MMKRLRAGKQLLVDLPRSLRLAYCLMRDPRVPPYVKIAFVGALVLIATPMVDLPEAIPVIGEIDVLALTALSVRLFIAACPDGQARGKVGGKIRHRDPNRARAGKCKARRR